jgi:hypothetical protein
METNKDGGFEKNRQRQRTPDADGKVKTPLKPNRKDSYFEAHNEREQAGDANRRENVQKARCNVTARPFRRDVSGISR